MVKYGIIVFVRFLNIPNRKEIPELKIGNVHIEFRYQVIYIFLAVLGVMLVYSYYISKRQTEPVVTALMFHSVNPKGPAGEEEDSLVITPEKLDLDLEYLKQQGYRFIGADQMVELLTGPDTREANSHRCVLVTFDDGYRDNYLHAYPVLKRQSVKAVINIVVHYVERYDLVIPNRYLLWRHINEMRKSGIIQIGSHTYNSHKYDRLEYGEGPVMAGRRVIEGKVETYSDYQNRIRLDLSNSVRYIRKGTGKFPMVIAFPYGKASPEAERIARDIGFKVQMGIKPGANTDSRDLQNLKRITVKCSCTPEQLEERLRYYIGARLLLP